MSPRTKAAALWGALVLALALPVLLAAASPLLQWRDPVYILAGFAGIAALALMLLQPLLAGGWLPGLPRPVGRHIHRRVGLVLVALVGLHVAGLWLTSPPDVIDALLFRSPTPFSAWGVTAMWALLAAAFWAGLRRRIPLRRWRLGHSALVAVAVLGTVVHALRIDGTMEPVSKAALCLLVVLATVKTMLELRAWSRKRRAS